MNENLFRVKPRPSLPGHLVLALCLVALMAGCASTPSPAMIDQVRLPLLRGWYDAEEVFYVTTDVSNADVARAKGANFAPRLAEALPVAGATQPGHASSVDKVYAVTNFEQASVFGSAPDPVGHLNRDVAYSPLWQMIKVTWTDGATRRTLKSDEDVLAAAEKGEVSLEATRVVLNCPIVHRGSAHGTLPEVTFGAALH